MNTTVTALNNALKKSNSFYAENMESREAILRLLLAAVSLGLLFAASSVAHMMLLVSVAVYLFATAMMQWDPLYTVLTKKMSDTIMDATIGKSEGLVHHGIGSQDSFQAANDTKHSRGNAA